jgi:hypothetical protein
MSGVTGVLKPERVHALEEREFRTGGENPERRQKRPEVALLTIAERVPGVSRALAAAQGGPQEGLVERVREPSVRPRRAWR